MNLKALLVSFAAGLFSGFAVGLLVTALLDKVIWPSLFVGIPAGILDFAVVFGVLYWKLKSRI
jgi:large-conductance mechanosensitive channel